MLTADGESALSELDLCPHDKNCLDCVRTQLAASGFCDVQFHDVAEIGS